MKDVISEKMKIKSMKETTKDLKIEAIEDPEMFYIPLQQHIGFVKSLSRKKDVFFYNSSGAF